MIIGDYIHNLMKYNKILLIIIILFFHPESISNEIKSISNQKSLPIEAKFCLKYHECIYLEVARSKTEQSQGLMYRHELKDNNGMLFTLDKPRKINIWMYNTFIPLDIIFIKNNRIVKLINNAIPCSSQNCKKYHSNYIVDSIIELNAGKIKSLNLSKGDLIEVIRISYTSKKY